jgi:catechol 2,3-dioxygenase
MEVGAAAPAPTGNGVGLHHLAFKVGDSPEELRAVRGRLEAAGYPGERASEHTVSQALYLCDPDGIAVELYVDADPRTWKEHPAAVASVKPLGL